MQGFIFPLKMRKITMCLYFDMQDGVRKSRERLESSDSVEELI